MNGIEIDTFRKNGGLGCISSGQKDDLFVVCASYEDRSLGVVESLSAEYKCKNSIIYFNPDFMNIFNSDRMKENLEKLKHKLEKHSDNVIVSEGSWLDAKYQLEAIKNSLNQIEIIDSANITVDITTFNREALLVLILLIRSRIKNPYIRSVYTSPINHGEWLTRGFRFIRNVLGFNGLQNSKLSNVLCLLSGFEPDRSLKIIEEHEPSQVLLGIADPPTDKGFLHRNIDEQKLIMARQGVCEFNFPAGDIAGSVSAIEDVLTPYFSNYNIVIAPMSTKPSTIASLIVAEKHQDIQISYCLPGEYNISNYSTGIKKIYICRIP